MERSALLKSAMKIQPASPVSANEYQENIEQMVVKMNSYMQGREDILDLIGKKNLAMMRDNHANHARFIGSILANYNPEVLVDTVLWVFRAYRSRGFSSNYWAAQLNAWIMILKETLNTDAYKEIYPYYEWMQINIPYFVELSEVDLGLNSSEHS